MYLRSFLKAGVSTIPNNPSTINLLIPISLTDQIVFKRKFVYSILFHPIELDGQHIKRSGM